MLASNAFMREEEKRKPVVLIALYDVDAFSVRTLHAVLKKDGFHVYSIFFKQLSSLNTMEYPKDYEIKALISLLKNYNPLLVCFAVRQTYFKLIARLTQEIKREIDTKIVWGGIHPTSKPKQCIEYADIVCVGEGEEVISELASKLSKGESIHEVKGLWFKDNGEIKSTGLRRLIQDLDSIPFPDFSNENKFLLEDGKMAQLPKPEERTWYGIMTSRGCLMQCTFCYNSTLKPMYKDKGTFLRRRSVENVIRECLYAKQQFKNLSMIYFEDDIFAYDLPWIKKFTEQYVNSINIPFWCQFFPTTTNEEIAQLLKKAGVADMTMGVQTGSQEFRTRYYERFGTNEQIVKAAQILHKNNINCAFDLIMDNPLETDYDRRETLKLLLNFPRPFRLQTHTLTYFSSAKYTQTLLDKGLISRKDIEDEKPKSYESWTPSLDLRRDNTNLFWDNLYYMTSRKYFPRKLIILLSNSKILRRRPRSLTYLLKLTSPYIATVNPKSKIDMIRWYLVYSLSHPARVWNFLRLKIKNFGAVSQAVQKEG